MRFLIDNQLPAALCGWLRERGHDAEHVLHVGLAQGKDTPVWRHAQEKEAVIITKDEDFAEWVRRGRAVPRCFGCELGTAQSESCSAGWSRCCPLSYANSSKEIALWKCAECEGRYW